MITFSLHFKLILINHLYGWNLPDVELFPVPNLWAFLSHLVWCNVCNEERRTSRKKPIRWPEFWSWRLRSPDASWMFDRRFREKGFGWNRIQNSVRKRKYLRIFFKKYKNTNVKISLMNTLSWFFVREKDHDFL